MISLTGTVYRFLAGSLSDSLKYFDDLIPKYFNKHILICWKVRSTHNWLGNLILFGGQKKSIFLQSCGGHTPVFRKNNLEVMVKSWKWYFLPWAIFTAGILILILIRKWFHSFKPHTQKMIINSCEGSKKFRLFFGSDNGTDRVLHNSWMIKWMRPPCMKSNGILFMICEKILMENWYGKIDEERPNWLFEIGTLVPIRKFHWKYFTELLCDSAKGHFKTEVGGRLDAWF